MSNIKDPSELTNIINGFDVGECCNNEEMYMFLSVPNIGYGLVGNIVEKRGDNKLSPSGRMSWRKEDKIIVTKENESVNLIDDFRPVSGFKVSMFVLMSKLNDTCSKGEGKFDTDLVLPIPIKISPADKEYRYISPLFTTGEVTAGGEGRQSSLYTACYESCTEMGETPSVPEVLRTAVAVQIARTAAVLEKSNDRFVPKYRATEGSTYESVTYDDDIEVKETITVPGISPIEEHGNSRIEYQMLFSDKDGVQEYADILSIDNTGAELTDVFVKPCVFLMSKSKDSKPRLYYSKELSEHIIGSIKIKGVSESPTLEFITAVSVIKGDDLLNIPSWASSLTPAEGEVMIGIDDPDITKCMCGINTPGRGWFRISSEYLTPITNIRAINNKCQICSQYHELYNTLTDEAITDKSAVGIKPCPTCNPDGLIERQEYPRGYCSTCGNGTTQLENKEDGYLYPTLAPGWIYDTTCKGTGISATSSEQSVSGTVYTIAPPIFTSGDYLKCTSRSLLPMDPAYSIPFGATMESDRMCAACMGSNKLFKYQVWSYSDTYNKESVSGWKETTDFSKWVPVTWAKKCRLCGATKKIICPESGGKVAEKYSRDINCYEGITYVPCEICNSIDYVKEITLEEHISFYKDETLAKRIFAKNNSGRYHFRGYGNGTIACNSCKGSGYFTDDITNRCIACDGMEKATSGRYLCPDHVECSAPEYTYSHPAFGADHPKKTSGLVFKRHILGHKMVACKVCDGNMDVKCPQCNGTGEEESTECYGDQIIKDSAISLAVRSWLNARTNDSFISWATANNLRDSDGAVIANECIHGRILGSSDLGFITNPVSLKELIYDKSQQGYIKDGLYTLFQATEQYMRIMTDISSELSGVSTTYVDGGDTGKKEYSDIVSRNLMGHRLGFKKEGTADSDHLYGYSNVEPSRLGGYTVKFYPFVTPKENEKISVNNVFEPSGEYLLLPHENTIQAAEKGIGAIKIGNGNTIDEKLMAIQKDSLPYVGERVAEGGTILGTAIAKTIYKSGGSELTATTGISLDDEITDGKGVNPIVNGLPATLPANMALDISAILGSKVSELSTASAVEHTKVAVRCLAKVLPMVSGFIRSSSMMIKTYGTAGDDVELNSPAPIFKYMKSTVAENADCFTYSRLESEDYDPVESIYVLEYLVNNKGLYEELSDMRSQFINSVLLLNDPNAMIDIYNRKIACRNLVSVTKIMIDTMYSVPEVLMNVRTVGEAPTQKKFTDFFVLEYDLKNSGILSVPESFEKMGLFYYNIRKTYLLMESLVSLIVALLERIMALCGSLVYDISILPASITDETSTEKTGFHIYAFKSGDKPVYPIMESDYTLSSLPSMNLGNITKWLPSAHYIFECSVNEPEVASMTSIPMMGLGNIVDLGFPETPTDNRKFWISGESDSMNILTTHLETTEHMEVLGPLVDKVSKYDFMAFESATESHLQIRYMDKTGLSSKTTEFSTMESIKNSILESNKKE